MQINKELSQVTEVLKETVSETKKTKKFFDRIQKALKEEGFEDKDINETFNNFDTLISKGENTTLLVLKIFYAMTNDERLNPENFFTEAEINMMKSFVYKRPEAYTKLSFPHVFDYVIEGNDNTFTTVLTARDLGELKLSGMIQWNPNVQREAKHIKTSEGIKEVPNIYEANKKEIKKNILNGTQEQTLIVLNVPLDKYTDEEQMDYDKKHKRLIVEKTEGVAFDVVDGAHRVWACADAILKDSDNAYLDKTHFVVTILNLTDEEAKRYQEQLARATPIKRSRIKEMKKDTWADTVVDNLKNDSTSDFRGRITTNDSAHLKNGGGQFTTYLIMSESINESFKDVLQKRYDTRAVTKSLEAFYGDLFGYLEDYLEDSDSLLFSPVTFGMWNSMARDVYDKKYTVEDIIDTIDPKNFSEEKLQKENPDELTRIKKLRSRASAVGNKNNVERMKKLFKVGEVKPKVNKD